MRGLWDAKCVQGAESILSIGGRRRGQEGEQFNSSLRAGPTVRRRRLKPLASVMVASCEPVASQLLA